MEVLILSIIYQQICPKCIMIVIVTKSLLLLTALLDYYVDFYLTGYTTPLISTQVEGYGDSINVSNLPVGDYTVVIIERRLKKLKYKW